MLKLFALMSIGSLTISATFAQLTLDHIFPNAGFNQGTSAGQVFLWEFEAAGTKYVKIDRNAKYITLYNLDFTVHHSFSFTQAPSTTGFPYILYLSQHLFDPDDAFEYLYYHYAGMPNTQFLRVYKEDGTELLSRNDCSVNVLTTTHAQQFPVFQTPDGWKLIISCSNWPADPTAEVYSLSGGWNGPTGMIGDPWLLPATSMQHVYPNPVDQQLRIAADAGVTAIRIHAQNGAVVLEHAVARASDQGISVDVGRLANGMYMLMGQGAQGWFALGRFAKQ